jgi:hypothetical protein
MKHPKVSPEQQDFIKEHSSNLSIMEIAQQLGLQRNKSLPHCLFFRCRH